MMFHLIVSTLPLFEEKFRKRFGAFGTVVVIIAHLAPLGLYLSDYYMESGIENVSKFLLPLLFSIFTASFVGLVFRVMYTVVEFAKNKKKYDQFKLLVIVCGATLGFMIYKFENELAEKGKEEYSSILLGVTFLLASIVIALPIFRWYED